MLNLSVEEVKEFIQPSKEFTTFFQDIIESTTDYSDIVKNFEFFYRNLFFSLELKHIDKWERRNKYPFTTLYYQVVSERNEKLNLFVEISVAKVDCGIYEFSEPVIFSAEIKKEQKQVITIQEQEVVKFV